MSRAKFWTLISVAVVLSISVSAALSNKQDDQNYRHDYVYQDTSLTGKPGILITALGQPEEYDFNFFNRYISMIFRTAFPPDDPTYDRLKAYMLENTERKSSWDTARCESAPRSASTTTSAPPR